jgi:hypothetical protein
VGATLGYSPEFMGKVLGNSAKVNELHYWHPAADLTREITHRVADTIAAFSDLQHSLNLRTDGKALG